MTEATSEFYRPRQVTPVSSEIHHEDPSTKSPFAKRETVASTLNPPQVENPKRSWNPFKKSEQVNVATNYAIVSPEHGRAIIDTRINNKVIWGGNLPGDIYGARDWKGANMDSVRLIKDECGYLGYRVQGLKDSIGINRIEKVSQFLRENGLPTEHPTKVVKILEISKYGKKIPVGEWKEETTKALEESVIALEKSSNFEAAEREKQEVADVKAYFESVDFFIEERDLQTAERLRDLERLKDEISFKSVVEPIFKWVNKVFDYKKSGLIGGTNAPERFTFTQDDIKRYFGEWLPTQMGIYLARMHKLGLAHGFTHAQNWSAVGTLYDLDSVSGLPEDATTEDKSMASDTRETVGALAELFDSQTNYLRSNFPELTDKAQAVLVSSYIKERFGNQINNEQLESIKNNYFQYTGRGDVPISANVWMEVAKSLVQLSVK